MTAVGCHEQPPIGQLAADPPGVIDRNERIAIPADHERRHVDPAQVARRQQWLDRHIGRDRRQEAAPSVHPLASVVAPAVERNPLADAPAVDSGTDREWLTEPDHDTRNRSEEAT